MSKQFAPPPRPACRAAPKLAQAKPAVPAARPLQRVAPPPTPARAAASVQRFTSFSDRAANRDTTKAAPPGDELVNLGNGAFGARDGARGLISRPDGTYNFVRTQGRRRIDQRILISSKAGHAQLSHGSPVVYAGTVRFSRGALEWWSNYSGHYQPIAEFRDQAQLPGDKFVPWQKLQMGGTAMQRGMFRDQRPKAGPAAAETDKTDSSDKGSGATNDAAPAGAVGAARGGAAAAKPES